MKNLQFTLPLLCIVSVISLCSCRKEKKTSSEAPVRVETITVAAGQAQSGRTYSGVIEEANGSVLSFKIPGTITRLNVSEGDRVARGQLIAELDASSLQSNYQIAHAALLTAQDTYNRMKKLHDANAIPEMKWVEVENALTSAKNAEQIARNSVGDTRLSSPIQGYVSEKFVDAGATVLPAAPVVKVVSLSPLKISISVSENEVGSITPSTEANVTVDAADGLAFKARYSEKSVSADPLSRSYQVKFITDNPDGRMLPGMLCTVSLSGTAAASDSSSIVVPAQAVLLGADNSSYLWLVENGKAVKRNVEIGDYTADGVVITSGLDRGDVVIVKGQQKVSPGLDVKPVGDGHESK